MSKLLVKTLASVLFIFIMLFFVLPQGFRACESRTRTQLMDLVASELPATATMPEIRAFLARHAEAVDDRQFRKDEVIGIMRQSRLDRWMLDRQVQIVLKVDSRGRLSSTEVRFYYTFL